MHFHDAKRSRRRGCKMPTQSAGIRDCRLAATLAGETRFVRSARRDGIAYFDASDLRAKFTQAAKSRYKSVRSAARLSKSDLRFAQVAVAGETRFEHATDGFGDRCSTVEPLP